MLILMGKSSLHRRLTLHNHSILVSCKLALCHTEETQYQNEDVFDNEEWQMKKSKEEKRWMRPIRREKKSNNRERKREGQNVNDIIEKRKISLLLEKKYNIENNKKKKKKGKIPSLRRKNTIFLEMVQFS